MNTDRIESDVTIYSPILEVAADVEPEAFIEKRDISKWLLLVGLVLFLLQAVIASKQGMEEGNV